MNESNRLSVRNYTRRIRQAILFTFMLLISLLLISPLVWLLSASFQNNGEIYLYPFRWIPHAIRFENYYNVWVEKKFGNIMLNTAVASLLMVCAQLFLCTAAGYVLTKFSFHGKKLIVLLILSTSMIPQSTTFFPVYAFMGKLHLLNTGLGLALPFFISGFGVFLMMQFARYVPNEMIESARLDGCSEWKIYFRIVIPLMKSALSSLAILAFSYIWSEYAWARLCTSDPEKQTLSVVLSLLAVNSDGSINTCEMLAGSVLAIAPVIILFVFFQKNFIESVTQSGIKG